MRPLFTLESRVYLGHNKPFTCMPSLDSPSGGGGAATLLVRAHLPCVSRHGQVANESFLIAGFFTFVNLPLNRGVVVVGGVLCCFEFISLPSPQALVLFSVSTRRLDSSLP